MFLPGELPGLNTDSKSVVFYTYRPSVRAVAAVVRPDIAQPCRPPPVGMVVAGSSFRGVRRLLQWCFAPCRLPCFPLPCVLAPVKPPSVRSG